MGLTGMSPLGLPFLLSPPLNAFVSGAIFYKKWKLRLYPCIVIMIAFPLHHPSASFGSVQVAIWVLWDKIIALVLILPLAIFSKLFSNSRHSHALFFLLALLETKRTMFGDHLPLHDHSVYNGIFGSADGRRPSGILSWPFLYPAIRLVQGSCHLIAVPLMRVLSGTNWLWSKENIFVPSEKPKQESITTTNPT